MGSKGFTTFLASEWGIMLHKIIPHDSLDNHDELQTAGNLISHINYDDNGIGSNDPDILSACVLEHLSI